MLISSEYLLKEVPVRPNCVICICYISATKIYDAIKQLINAQDTGVPKKKDLFSWQPNQPLQQIATALASGFKQQHKKCSVLYGTTKLAKLSSLFTLTSQRMGIDQPELRKEEA